MLLSVFGLKNVDRLGIHVKSQNYRYVDGIPSQAKLQISTIEVHLRFSWNLHI